MKSIRFRLLIATLCVLFATVVARSQAADTPPDPSAHSHGFGRRGREMNFFADYLNLSDTQRSQMKGILAKERPTLKPLFQQLQQARQQLKEYELGSYDEAKVRALATQQSQTMAELTVQQTRIHSELFQILTTDQQAKMKEVQARHEAHRQRHLHSAPAASPQQ
jgi:Spy/CpxP family protein refolding chaperone